MNKLIYHYDRTKKSKQGVHSTCLRSLVHVQFCLRSKIVACIYIDAKYGVASNVQLAICVSDACLKRVNVE